MKRYRLNLTADELEAVRDALAESIAKTIRGRHIPISIFASADSALDKVKEKMVNIYDDQTHYVAATGVGYPKPLCNARGDGHRLRVRKEDVTCGNCLRIIEIHGEDL